MLEYWNNGFWNAGAIVYWENEPDKNIKKQGTSFKKHYPITPIFQHFIIPCIGQKLKYPKTPLTSTS